MTQDQIIRKEVLEDLIANFKVAAAQSGYLNFLLRTLAKKCEKLIENDDVDKFYDSEKYKNECADITDLLNDMLSNLNYFVNYVPVVKE